MKSRAIQQFNDPITTDSLGSQPMHQDIVTLGGTTMGTTWSAKMVLPVAANLHAWHSRIQQQLDRVVEQMSPWKPDSDLCRFNRATAGIWYALPCEFADVLRCALTIAQKSHGAFDPTMGPGTDAWGFGVSPPSENVPPAAHLEQIRRQVNWQRLRLDDTNRLFQPGDIRLDLCGIAKGYGVDRVIALMQHAGVTAGLVEVGGEIRGYGAKPNDTAWQVLIETHLDQTIAALPARVLHLSGTALATSGDQWHHFEKDGKRYGHTLDPCTCAPVQGAPLAVTVLAHDAMHADAWATALTVMGWDAGFHFAEKLGIAARFLQETYNGASEKITASLHAQIHP